MDHLIGALAFQAAGADPNYQINQSSNVLSLAAINLDADFLNVLLQKGGNPNSFRVSARRHLIFEVLGPDRIEHLRTLLRFSPKLDVKDGTGSTPIIYAAILNNYTAMKLLIEKGADTSLKNNFGYDVLKVLEDNATRECHQSECSQLNELGIIVNKYDISDNEIKEGYYEVKDDYYEIINRSQRKNASQLTGIIAFAYHV